MHFGNSFQVTSAGTDTTYKELKQAYPHSLASLKCRTDTTYKELKLT